MNCLAMLMGLATSVSVAVDITSDRAGNVFTDDDPVQFRIATSADAILSVMDFDGKKVFERSLSAGDSLVEIGKLPRNHYTITVRSGDESRQAYFGVIPSMGSRPDIEDSAIASDLATSWLVKPDQFDDLAQLAKLSGIIWVRDRISWGEVETHRGNWAAHTRYDLAAEIQTKRGLKVYQVFHATPGWAQKDGKSHSFPDDLRDAYSFAYQMARRFKGKVAAWELWNEPDIIQFSDELGDAYSALDKAMYLGFKSADPELPVLICSFAMAPGKFAETIFQNGIQDYFDIYNYHIYDRWENHAGRALKHIELMRRYGVENKPVWLTEAGRPIKREPDDPSEVSPIVLRLQFPREFRDKKLETYLLPGDSSTKVGVEVYNFGSSQFSCKLRLQLPQGWKDKLDDEAISVSPMGRAVRELELSPNAGTDPEPRQIRVELINADGKIETFTVAWVAVKG